VALSEQRLSQLNARAADIEERLRGKETELAQTRAQFQQLTADFRYNLKLLEDRDAELERLDGAVVTHRAAAEKAEQALAAARATVNEKDAELRRQKARVGELEAYHAEKVDRLRKQTDEARYTRDDALQRQKDDFANLERALVRQLEEQKAALETERREALEETERLRLKQSTELEVPLNDLRRELSDEKAQTLALAAELEAWRLREENTRGELSKSETKRRAAEQNAGGGVREARRDGKHGGRVESGGG
jgi:chromosome segregation ATPase